MACVHLDCVKLTLTGFTDIQSYTLLPTPLLVQDLPATHFLPRSRLI